MHSIVLVLTGPLQSWGTRSRWNDRDSDPVPTLSGIAGLLAAAQGHPRADPPRWVEHMHLTVRSDAPGLAITDYHTANASYPLRPDDGHARKSSGGVHRPTVVTRRHYRADATFVAVASHPDPAVTAGWAHALRTPVWAPYLGRRSCPPALPPLLGASGADPQRLLRDILPLLRHPPRDGTPVSVLCTSGSTTPASRVNDLPLSWDPSNRQFGSREITEDLWDFPAQRCAGRGLDGWHTLVGALAADQPTHPGPAT